MVFQSCNKVLLSQQSDHHGAIKHRFVDVLMTRFFLITVNNGDKPLVKRGGGVVIKIG